MKHPKRQLSDYQEKLESKVSDLSQKLQIVEFFEDCKYKQDYQENLIILNDFRNFFIPTWTALKFEILVSLHSLFDESGNAKRSLIHFIKQVNANLKVLREDLPAKQIVLLKDEIANQVTKISSKKFTIDSIKTSRDRFYAHQDSKYFDNPKNLISDAPLPFSDVVELLEFCRDILEWHQRNTIDCATRLWDESRGRNHLEDIFSILERYFKMCDEIRKNYGSSTLIKMWE